MRKVQYQITPHASAFCLRKPSVGLEELFPNPVYGTIPVDLMDYCPPTTGAHLRQFVCPPQWVKQGISKFSELVASLHNFMEQVYRRTVKRKNAPWREFRCPLLVRATANWPLSRPGRTLCRIRRRFTIAMRTIVYVSIPMLRKPFSQELSLKYRCRISRSPTRNNGMNCTLFYQAGSTVPSLVGLFLKKKRTPFSEHSIVRNGS